MAETEPGQVGQELDDKEWQPAPRSEDIEALDDDALEKAIQEGASKQERERKEAAISRATPKAPKVEAEEAAGDREQETAETEDQPEGTEQAAEERQAEGRKDDPRELREELEIRRLENERLRAEMDRVSYQRDNLGGRIGHLEKTLRDISARPKDDLDVQQAPQPQDDEERRELRSELQSFRQERVQSAIQGVVSDFEANVVPKEIQRFESIWGKDSGKELTTKIEEIVKRRAPEFADEFSGTNPKRAHLAATTLLRSALADAQIETIQARRDAVQRERDKQREDLRARKQDSDMTGTRRSAPQPPRRAKSPDELSDEELDRAIQSAIASEVGSRSR